MDHTTTSPTPTTENLKERSGFVKIPWVSRIAYGLGDTSCNVVYGMINTLLTLFYTDYAGVPFVTVGLVMLISRFFDGSSDVIMGVVVSKTVPVGAVLVLGCFGQLSPMSSPRLPCLPCRRLLEASSSGTSS